ncbi:MAG TPA: ABC transporter permease [Candidatus Limnocylindrales bacterium]|jgi:osmoprotectant transport system permease protein|nr:ABC transporter permease [Candidatus Limnocylindrales bacterium]
MNELITWLTAAATWQGETGIPFRLLEHLAICAVSIAAATAIALPIGLYIGHTGRAATLAINLANIGRAVPSYAVIVIILPISLQLFPEYGLDLIPTFVAMVLLAIPPILVNAYAGLREVDRDLVEAARGMGLRERQILRNVELPLAAPVLMGGFRTAVLNVIATATIGAVVGFGGLGRFILDGRAKGIAGTGELLGGALLVAVLAVAIDLVLALIQRRLARHADPQRPGTDAASDLPEFPLPEMQPGRI